MAPERFGGFGDISAKARAHTEATGREFEKIIEEMYHPTEGKLITIPGVPPMYDYESIPQQPREERPSGRLLSSAFMFVDPSINHSFAKECDDFMSTNTSYEAESLDATRTWLSETNRSLYAVGPLMPPGVGGVGLSESSKKTEISFGTMFWPYKDEHVWLFVDALIELGVPFIFSHARTDVNIPEGVVDKIKECEHGILLQLIRLIFVTRSSQTFKGTGWILTHCGQNSIIAWPIGADQPLNAAKLTLDLDVAFELIELRTGHGLRPLYRGVTPKGTMQAVAAEARGIVQRARGPEGTEKAQECRNAER
ncbi:glycosyltransferase family 1 protein [Ramaria rubella]|nr:glycosyltransferase family 1 protein [Ramaria rubella]